MASSRIPLHEVNAIDALAVRDTVVHSSAPINSSDYISKTLIIHNGLNQEITVSLYGSRDEDISRKLLVGSAVVVAATTDDYQTLTDYFPHMSVDAQCSVAPTTGDVTVYIERTGG